MLRTKEALTDILTNRLEKAGPRARCFFDGASEVIVFGSMSIGLDRADSDMDILLIGDCDYKLKTDTLDLIVVPTRITKRSVWLQSELASHVAKYGIWIKGQSGWKSGARIGSRTIQAKRRRVAAFMRYLPDSWLKLEECFRKKYAVKLRRETQRLILLEQGVPVPPTGILDRTWPSISQSPHDVCDRLRQFADDAHHACTDDLLARVDADFYVNKQ
jgi:predicted nucleotidyltransferase